MLLFTCPQPTLHPLLFFLHQLNAIVEKRYKTTNDAQIAHNNYVLALAMFKEHQDLAYRNTIPKLLEGLFEVQKHHVRDFQAGMVQFFEAVDHTAKDYVKMQKDVMDEVGNLDGEKEYARFPFSSFILSASLCSYFYCFPRSFQNCLRMCVLTRMFVFNV